MMFARMKMPENTPKVDLSEWEFGFQAFYDEVTKAVSGAIQHTFETDGVDVMVTPRLNDVKIVVFLPLGEPDDLEFEVSLSEVVDAGLKDTLLSGPGDLAAMRDSLRKLADRIDSGLDSAGAEASSNDPS